MLLQNLIINYFVNNARINIIYLLMKSVFKEVFKIVYNLKPILMNV